MKDEAGNSVRLYTYWRSSSSYRVRIALNLKGIDYECRTVNLLRGEQRQAEYRAVNPLGLVPALQHGDRVIVQSTAICEYLEEVFDGPALLPAGALGRARVRSIVQTIASEIQPMNNLGVLQYLGQDIGQPAEAVSAWYRHWVARGFEAIETWLGDGDASEFCHGDRPTLADCYLVPQVYNAERYDCDLAPYPQVMEITERCRALDPFIKAAPENQPDAVV